MSVSVMGACSCGASSDAPNYECERCRLVYFVLMVQRMRTKAVEYSRALRSRDNDAKALATADYKRAEANVDKMLAKFCEQPRQQEFQLGDDGRYYEEGA